jgi:hypothetical protein
MVKKIRHQLFSLVVSKIYCLLYSIHCIEIDIQADMTVCVGTPLAKEPNKYLFLADLLQKNKSVGCKQTTNFHQK